MDNSINKQITRTGITVASIEMSKYGKLSAMLVQEVTIISEYEGHKHSNDLSQNIFGKEDFQDKPEPYENVQRRVAFMDVPANVTPEQVQAKMPKTACLYRIYSYAPILHSGHKAAIDNGITTKDDICDSQAIRYPQGHENEGELILHNKHVQYMTTNLWTTAKDDLDLRGNVDHPPYMSEDIAEELGQSTDIPEAAAFTIGNQEVQ